MKKNKLAIVLILIIGIVLSAALFFLFTKDRVEVVVGTQSVRGNTPITGEMVTTKSVDKEFLPKNYIAADFYDEVVGRYSDIGFAEGAVLTTANIATGDGNRAATIPEGYTIMNIALSSLPQGVVAGDYVNIMIGSSSSTMGKIVLTYQKVAVTNVLKDGDNKISGIEVQVTPDQAQKIEYAIQNGNISITLLPNDYTRQTLEIVDEEAFLRG